MQKLPLRTSAGKVLHGAAQALLCLYPRASHAGEGCWLSPIPLLLPKIYAKTSIPTAQGVCWVLEAWGGCRAPAADAARWPVLGSGSQPVSVGLRKPREY